MSLAILYHRSTAQSCVLRSPCHVSELFWGCIDTSSLSSHGFSCASWFLQPAFLLLSSGTASSIRAGTMTQIYKALLNEISSGHPKIMRLYLWSRPDVTLNPLWTRFPVSQLCLESGRSHGPHSFGSQSSMRGKKALVKLPFAVNELPLEHF